MAANVSSIIKGAGNSNSHEFEVLVFHQNVLNDVQNILEASLSEGFTDPLLCEKPIYVPPKLVKQTLDIFVTIRSVVASNGADSSLNGYLKAIVETFLRQIASCDSNEDVLRCASLAFLLRLLCLPQSSPLSPVKEISDQEAASLYQNTSLYSSIVQCLQNCPLALPPDSPQITRRNSRSNSELTNEFSLHDNISPPDQELLLSDDELTLQDQDRLITIFILHVVQFCHGVTLFNHTQSSFRFYPRKPCLDALFQCIVLSQNFEIRQLTTTCIMIFLSREQQKSVTLTSDDAANRVTIKPDNLVNEQHEKFMQDFSSCLSCRIQLLCKRNIDSNRSLVKASADNKKLFKQPIDTMVNETKAKHLLGFCQRVLHRLSPSNRQSLIIHGLLEHIDNYSITMAGTSEVKNLALLYVHLYSNISEYFDAVYNKNEEASTLDTACDTLKHYPKDELWNCHRQIVHRLIRRSLQQQHTIFNTRRESLHLQTIIAGLCCLLRTIDLVDEKEDDYTEENDNKDVKDFATDVSSDSIRKARRCDVLNIITFMMEEKESFVRFAIVESDPAIQQEVLAGIRRLIYTSTQSLTTPLLLYSAMIPTLKTLLAPPYKSIWKFCFQYFQCMIEAAQEIAIPIFQFFEESENLSSLSNNNKDSFLMIMDSLLFHTNVNTILEFHVERKQIITSEDLYNQFCTQCSLHDQQHADFGVWYRVWSQILFEYVFKDLILKLCSILRETEEPSEQAIYFLEEKPEFLEELSLAQLKSQDAAVYRNELRHCISSCFPLFGTETMLKINSLALDRLLTTSLAAPSFAYETNAWILPLLENCIRRDNLAFFLTFFLPLAKRLGEKAKKLSTDDTELIKIRHYKRLMEQLWALLPAFFRESLDGPAMLLDSTVNTSIFNVMIAHLDVPIVRDHVCSALSTLCKQLELVLPDSSQLEEKNSSCDQTFLEVLWGTTKKGTNQRKNISQNLKNLTGQANKIMGLLVVRFLQLHKTNTDTIQEQSETGRVAQVFLEALRGVVLICEPELLEQNIRNFVAAWDKAVAKSITMLKNNSSDCLTSPQFVLLSSECGALVDVVDALIPKLSTKTLQEIYFQFLQLLHDCSEGLQFAMKEPKNDFFKKKDVKKKKTENHKLKLASCLRIASTESSQQKATRTLQCLLRRAYKGLKHITERFLDYKDPSIILTLFPLDSMSEIWKTLLATRDSSRFSAVKARVAFLRPFVFLVARIRPMWNQQESNSVLDFLKSLLTGLIPEILLGLAEANKTVRNESQDLLKCIADRLASVDEILLYLLPGFAGQTSTMRAATLMALRCLFRFYGDKINKSLQSEIFSIALVLLQEQDKKLFTLAVSFIRTFQRQLNYNEIPIAVKEYIVPMLSSPYAMTHRLGIRNLLDKAVKRAGVDLLKPCFPEEHLPLLTFVDRALKKRRNRKLHLMHQEDRNQLQYTEASRRHATRQESKGPIKANLSKINRNAVSSESSNDDDDSDDGNTKLTKPIQVSGVTSSSHNAVITDNSTCNLKSLLDAFEAEMDSGDESPLKAGYNAKRRLQTEKTPLRVLVDSQNTNLLSENPDSILLMTSPAKKRRVCDSPVYMNDIKLEKSMSNKSRAVSNGSNSFGSVRNPSGANPFAFKRCSSAAPQLHPPSLSMLKEKRETLKALRLQKKGHHVQKSAGSFRSSKAQGDMKKNSRVMPYAYIRLNPNMLKEKHRSEAINIFKENLHCKGKNRLPK